MQKRYLALVLPCCFALAWLACCVSACSSEQGSETSESGVQSEATTTTTTELTTTTLAPATWESVTVSGDLPASRLGSSMVFLADSSRLLIFGGYDGSTYYGDLWACDLSTDTWIQLEPAGAAPAGRAAHAMTYDPVRDQLIVFGGYDGSTCYRDVWAYDLASGSWSLLPIAGRVPHERYGHSLVYDPDSESMLLFGGYDGTAQYADTWSYSPATNVWTALEPAGELPEARDSQALAYDSDNKVFVLFGGWSATTLFDDTWAYDPATNVWTLLRPVSGSPTARALHQMIYDSSIEKFVMFGGGTSTTTFDDAWLFDLDEDTWVPIEAEAEQHPSARAGLAMAFDTAAQQVVVFGGSDGLDTYFNDLWSLRR